MKIQNPNFIFWTDTQTHVWNDEWTDGWTSPKQYTPQYFELGDTMTSSSKLLA